MDMKKGLCWLIVLTLLVLLAPAALGETQENEIEAIISGMTLEEKVGQMMVVSFRVWKEVPAEKVEGAEEPVAVNITELNDSIRACLRDYHFGGTVLFAQNCRDAEQVRKPSRWRSASAGGCGSGGRQRCPPRLWHHRAWQHGAGGNG